MAYQAPMCRDCLEALAFIEYFDGLKGDGRLSNNYSIGQITLNPETCY